MKKYPRWFLFKSKKFDKEELTVHKGKTYYKFNIQSFFILSVLSILLHFTSPGSRMGQFFYVIPLFYIFICILVIFLRKLKNIFSNE